LAKIKGLDPIIATCSANNVEFVKNLGATHAIDYNKEDVVTRVKEITEGRGVDYAIDALSGESATNILKTLAIGGQIVCVVAPPTIKPEDLFDRALSVHSVFLDRTREELGIIGRKIGELLSTKQIHPTITQVIKFEDIKDALIKMKEAHTRGKIVATVQSPQSE